jgi:hypothetical protein
MTAPTLVARAAAITIKVVIVLLLACTAACVTPARNDPQYVSKAIAALQAATSNVQTGLLVVRQDRAGKALGPYADEVVTASETALGSISTSFTSVQPPDQHADDVRDSVSDVLSQAEDALGHARIAVRRADKGALADSEQELHSVAEKLDTAEENLR